MKVKFKDYDLELHYSMRIYMLVENLRGESINDENSITTAIELIYATIVSTLKYMKIEDKVSLDDVIELIDENGGINFINEFSAWFYDCVNKESALVEMKDEPKDNNDNGDKKKS